MYQKNTSLILSLKKANAESIYSAIVEYCREKNIQLGRHIGMGFDGAATFSGDKTGVQRRLKELSPHALFVHCLYHVVQLASEALLCNSEVLQGKEHSVGKAYRNGI